MAFWSEWKASLIMDVLVGCIIFSIGLGYEIVTKKESMIFASKTSIGIIIFTLSAFNYLVFNHNDTWKIIVKEFDKWPKKKNFIGGIIAWSVMFLIFGSVILMFYLMSQINWKEYR